MGIVETLASFGADLDALDASGRTDMLGTIAGDDTILIICPATRAARDLVADFDRLARSAGVMA